MIFKKSFTTDEPISRSSLAWLFAAQIFIIAPHLVTVPKWIAAIWLLVAFWRWKIFQGAWSYPNKLYKTILVGLTSLGLAMSFGLHFSFESMISLLLIGFILKLIELKNRRDFVLLIFIAFFILAAQFIEFNNMVAALYGFGCLILLCTTQMQLYKKPFKSSIWKEMLSSIYILLQAIPFMVILFVVVPRIGSLWVVPTPQHAKTGMSDSMSPGDFTQLMESDELAFRVSFEGPIPPHEKLYWRSLVFSQFNGRRWSQNRDQLSQKNMSIPVSVLESHIDYRGDQISYEVVAEASDKPWLYVLAAPQSWSGNVFFARDLRLQSFDLVVERMSYRVTSLLNYQMHEIDSAEPSQNLQLPAEGNPLTRLRAKEWLAETGSTEKLIEKLFHYYNQSFMYTLQPPSLGLDVVDDFLWQTRQGFCEHFSGSFVFFMRAAGIPARVVVGYQGGDVNSVDGYLVVRQRDAHAWAEVWLENRGWVMFDPTGAVAPERIQKGIQQSLSVTDQNALAKPFGSSVKLLLALREQWDAANYKWTRWIMNYDSNSQATALERILGDVSPLRIGVFVLCAGGISGGIIFLFLMLRVKKVVLSESALLYRAFCRKLLPMGFMPNVGETPRQFVKRVIDAQPQLAPSLEPLLDGYEALTYGENLSATIEFKKALAAFRPIKIKLKTTKSPK